VRFLTLPNLLTLLRICLIPCFVLAFYFPFHGHRYITALIFFLAAVTDWLDGFLARSLGQTSAFGAFLDPVADKLIIATALVLLVSQYPTFWIAVPGAIIVCREIAISALREWMAELGKRATIKVSAIGKIKTAAQMTALLILLSQAPDISHPLVQVGIVFMYIAVILTIWSMLLYMLAAWRALASEKD
jgi:CDP-diacylglycerol--glycerol-3-phosphate 3-phosphatidyltransferase